MSDDLIARLRDKARSGLTYGGLTLCEAADALEAKDRRIAELEDAAASDADDFDRGYRAGLQTGGKERELLRTRIAELEESIDANDKWAEGFIEKTDARIAELEAALKPFADKCEHLEGMYPPYENDDWTELTMDCLRAARAALGEKEPAPPNPS